nr:hypothetical protein [Clostridia bacterium]
MIKKTNFRIVASILVIALLLMGISTMLIACDKNSNNNRNNNNNSDDVILTANKDIDGFLDNALGYVMSKNKKIYTIGIFNLLSSELESWMAGGTVLG